MSRLTWQRVTTGLDYPEDIVYEAVTEDGCTLGACYLEACGPYAYAQDAGGRRFDSIAIPGADIAAEIAAGKRVARRLLDRLRRDRERSQPCSR